MHFMKYPGVRLYSLPTDTLLLNPAAANQNPSFQLKVRNNLRFLPVSNVHVLPTAAYLQRYNATFHNHRNTLHVESSDITARKK
jgi:hypothetical protein